MTTPTYIYKILPSSPPPPSPLPRNLPLSALDRRDGFIHLSTSLQLLRTLSAFFASEESVYILRIPYERVEKYITWEDSKGKEPTEKGGCWDTEGKKGFFPHIYNNGDEKAGDEAGLKLGRDEVESMKEWKRGDGKWTGQSWPWGEEDRPVA